MKNTYAVDIRRKLHMYPEIGFDLPKTLALLRDELSKIGIDYTEKYGKSSIVATINPEKKNYTIGIRADIDALPIWEENDVPYKSRIDGRMHACGHDAHTAIALATLKELYEERDKINCCVKFIFQSGEETYCGAEYIAEDGVMKDIDCIIALHAEPNCEAGKILITKGPQNANADHFTLEFFGKSAHAARQQNGIDANMVAIKAYTAIESIMTKGLSANEVVIFNAGEIHGGTASNIVSDYCRMNCTLRTWNDETEKKLLDQIEKVSKMTAEMFGASSKLTMGTHYPILVNDFDITERMIVSAGKVIGKENISDNQRNMGGEDFACFAIRKPACMFRLGIANEGKRSTYGLHSSKFDIDEDALDIGVRIFKQFVFDNMDR